MKPIGLTEDEGLLLWGIVRVWLKHKPVIMSEERERLLQSIVQKLEQAYEEWK